MPEIRQREPQLTWTTDKSMGYAVEVARIGAFEVTITEGGAATIGVNVFVGTFAGRVCAIAATREKAEKAINQHAMREILRAGRELRPEEKAP
jgi:hypothetical protein